MSPPEAVVQHWNDRLHFGDFAGTTSKLIYLVACLVGVGLVVTGFVIWWLKRRARDRARQRRTEGRPRIGTASPLAAADATHAR